MQKVRGQALSPYCYDDHSPSTACRFMILGSISLPSPGFFSTFPHGTCALSVRLEYLALDRGRPGFLQNSTCSVVLGIPLGNFRISHTRLSLSLAYLPRYFCYPSVYHIEVPQPPLSYDKGFRLLPLRSPLLGESL